MKPDFWIIALVLFFVIHASREQRVTWFSTNHEIKELLKDETTFTSDLGKNLKTAKRSALRLKSALENTIERGKAVLSDKANDTGDFLEYFHVLRQYEKAWDDLTTEQDEYETLTHEVPLHLLLRFPTAEDRATVSKSLLEDQKMFHLDTHDLAEGRIVGNVQEERLSADECVLVGSVALAIGEYDLCISWLEEAKNRFQSGEKVRDDETDIVSVLERCRDYKVYHQLCGMVDNQRIPTEPKRHLKCYLWTNRHPWLLLQPVKMEMYSVDPFIVRFYDVISEEEMQALKTHSSPRLKRGLVASDIINPENVKLDSVRVSSVHFMSENESVYDEFSHFDRKLVRRINKRVGHLTGSNMDFTSELQVATYGIGGHVGPHVDTSNRSETPATFMFYLSDVQYGGSTAFVRLGLAIPPIKGSALFWHNQLSSGEDDARTTHAGCPVLLGTKWVANKWIYVDPRGKCM